MKILYKIFLKIKEALVEKEVMVKISKIKIIYLKSPKLTIIILKNKPKVSFYNLLMKIKKTIMKFK